MEQQNEDGKYSARAPMSRRYREDERELPVTENSQSQQKA